IVVMNHGVIEQVGTPTEIYREPGSLFVANFVGEMNQLSGIATGPHTVQLGTTTFSSQPHGLKSGTKGVVSIRPEDVIPHGSGARSPGAPDNVDDEGNAFNGTIKEMEFLGSYWRARIGGGLLDGNNLIADFSINAVRRMSLAEGKTITVELPSDRLQFFLEDEKGSVV
ncbi:MAG: TOBE domain-containing protein, partial [Methyloligellaceae bacterium]